MAGFGLTRFGGLRPRVSPRLLPEEYAQEAHNTRLVDGSVSGWRSIRKVQDTAPPAQVFKPHDMNGCQQVVAFDHCVSLIDFPAPGSVADLEHYVVFHHDGSEPQRWFPSTNTWASLVVPAPMRQLQVTQLTATSLDTTLYPNGPDMRVYTYTWVDQFGVESPPAPPSVPVRSWVDETWRLTGFDAPPPNAEYVRIYRSMPSYSDGQALNVNFDASFQLLAEVEVAALGASFDDTVTTSELELGTLLTAHDQPPPVDLEQVVGTEQGYLVGFKGNDLFVSERHEAHNWPHQYRHSFPERIKALVPYGEHVFVLTTGRPYRIRPQFKAMQGNDNDMELEVVRYETPMPLMGSRAWCLAPWGALYVTRKGLAALSAQDQRIITYQRVGIDDWERWAPNVLAWWEGYVVAFRSPAGRGFVLDLPSSADELEPGDLVTVDNPGVTALHLGLDGLLYVGYADGVGVWQEGAARADWVWRSKIFRMPSPIRFSACQINADGEVTVSLYVDGQLAWRYDFTGSYDTARLPQVRRGVEFEVELEGRNATVYGVWFATSRSELKWGQK